MVNGVVRSVYFSLMRVPMMVGGLLYRVFMSPRKGLVRVQLGSGRKRYLEGWINVDANVLTARVDVWADLRNRLPFRDNSVDVFYSHHVIEHLPERLLPFHFREMFRCLKPGGLVRIGVPNGDSAIRKFIEGDKSWFGDWPESRKSVGGRLANFIMCAGEHKTIMTGSYLHEIVSDAGFIHCCFCRPGLDTGDSSLIGEEVLQTEDESDPDTPHTLVIEARKG